MNRRHSLKLLAAAAAYAQLPRCGDRAGLPFPVHLSGANDRLGHKLREGRFPDPTRTSEQRVLIVGAGVAGLSAARTLAQAGVRDFLVIDLEVRPGGNSRGGSNKHGRFPLGAHYLPVPDPSDEALIDFLRECGVCGGIDGTSGLPIHGEEHLCADPHERLFMNGVWRSGLRPRHALNVDEEAQFERFEACMDAFGALKGSDGRWAFAIPIDRSSQAPDVHHVRALDGITMAAWMRREGFTCPAIQWYVDYCCRDDYGADMAMVSAFAGIHYFAARRGSAANAAPGSVLTWPEGNGFLVNALFKHSERNWKDRQLAFAVRPVAGAVEVDVYDDAASASVRYRAEHVVLCVPQFIAGRLLGNADDRARALHYAPWAVVNLSLDRAPEERGGEPMAWDNVRFNSPTLGYVNASHQVLDPRPERILTHYRALTARTVEEAREQAHARGTEAWVSDALDELRVMHPDIDARIVEAEVALWGHGMVVPVPGLITGEIRQRLAVPQNGRIHFAHSDLSGMSIFEEAFHHGRRAASDVLARLSPAPQA